MALIDLHLEATPGAVARARHEIDRLVRRLPRDLVDDLRLMVSELVTNCLRHGRLAPWDLIHVVVDHGDRGVRVEVVNPGSGFRPPDSQPSLYATSGWGLFLVSRLADQWGVDARGGTRVWLEVDHSQRHAGPRAD